jgi:hypothetical protein
MVSEHTQKRQNLIKAGFIMQGTSLHAWCIANGVKPQNASKALLGQWTGPKAADLVQRILVASGVSSE